MSINYYVYGKHYSLVQQEGIEGVGGGVGWVGLLGGDVGMGGGLCVRLYRLG